MRKIFFFITFFISSVFFSKDLVIHMDINKTIIAFDSKQKHDQNYVLNVILSKQIYGIWMEGIQKPISYHDYVFEYILPNFSDKQARHRAKIEAMNAMLEEMKKIDHPDFEKAQKKIIKARNTLNDLSFPIFPSFIHLLTRLEESGIDYSIVFRSFGRDAPQVFSLLIENGLLEETPRQFTMKKHVLTEKDISWTTPEEIERELTKQKFSFIQDDYWYWHNANETGPYGKIFPQTTLSPFSIFFDDHIEKPGAEHNVVSILSDFPLNFETVFLENKAISVDTFEAIINPEYFIQHIPLLNSTN